MQLNMMAQEDDVSAPYLFHFDVSFHVDDKPTGHHIQSMYNFHGGVGD